jgi:hypothetical protein
LNGRPTTDELLKAADLLRDAMPNVAEWLEQQQDTFALRDAEIKEAFSFIDPSLSRNARANELARLFNRYYLNAWRKDQLLEVCPEKYRGSVETHFFCALKLRNNTLSADTITRIL